MFHVDTVSEFHGIFSHKTHGHTSRWISVTASSYLSNNAAYVVFYEQQRIGLNSEFGRRVFLIVYRQCLLCSMEARYSSPRFTRTLSSCTNARHIHRTVESSIHFERRFRFSLIVCLVVAVSGLVTLVGWTRGARSTVSPV